MGRLTLQFILPLFISSLRIFGSQVSGSAVAGRKAAETSVETPRAERNRSIYIRQDRKVQSNST